jgi:membrane protease YdiL (CAAX protease family)
MPFTGMLSNLPPFQKLLFAIGIMFLSSFIFLVISFAIIKFHYGINLFSNSDMLNDFNNPAVLKSMKLLQVLSGGIGLFIFPAFASAYFFDSSSLEYLQLKKRAALISFLIVIIILFASMPFINWMVEINSHLKLPSTFSPLEQWMRKSEDEAAKLTEAFLAGTSITSLLLNLVIVALLPAFGEELFFRGIMQKLFLQMTKNKHVAIIITSIIFSAIHLQFYGFLPRMVLGIFLGYLLVWSGSLWLPVLAHFVNNAAAVIFTFLQQQNKIGFDPETVGTNSDEKIMLMTSVVMTFFLTYLIFKMEKKKAAPDF